MNTQVVDRKKHGRLAVLVGIQPKGIRAISSVGRATHLHWEGRRFESCIAHNKRKVMSFRHLSLCL